MFKIVRLSLYGMEEGQAFSYQFSDGINYFQGKNDSGKTEFYTFLDYMFGASFKLSDKDWYKNTLESAELDFVYNDHEFVITCFLSNQNKNYFRYHDDDTAEEICLDEYRAKLNSIFSGNSETLRELRTFVGEDIGYRTFTVFNFLGENRQGILNDFFDKCSRIEYAIKMPSLLNYIFNRNIARINELKKQAEDLKSRIAYMEKQESQNNDIQGRVNLQLRTLGIPTIFDGSNSKSVLQDVVTFQNSLEKKKSAKNIQAITELEAIYTSLDEQLKKQESFESDHKRFIEDDVKQQELLSNLFEMVNDKPEYSYLATPIINLISDLEKSISFNKYFIQEATVRELKKQRDLVKQKILSNQARFTIYSASEKTQAITLIREYLSYYTEDFDSATLKELKKELKEVQERIRNLQSENDSQKIDDLSDEITKLYRAAAGSSDLAEYDFGKSGFHISYLKSGNILQPQITDDDTLAGNQSKNYYTGSMARHTLIQLCGYLGFLRMLINDGKYPLIPFLVVDHISKPFDTKNQMALGVVLHAIYEDISKEQLQIILFDDKEPSELGITPDRATSLLLDGKSGFNPFYSPVIASQEDSPDEE